MIRCVHIVMEIQSNNTGTKVNDVQFYDNDDIYIYIYNLCSANIFTSKYFSMKTLPEKCEEVITFDITLNLINTLIF